MAETGRRNDSRNHRSADQRRYRKVSMCMYGDEKFCELSKPKPNGQSLWHYLIVGPRTTNLPGLFRVHLSEIASYFEWKPRDLRRVLDEILSKSMALHDEKACVFFLPNAIKHNEPTSWNVIKGWRATFDEIPPTPLKARALTVWREHIEQAVAKGLDRGFLDAFADAFPDAFADGIPRNTRQSRGIQEQEIEQEKEDPLPQPLPDTGRGSRPEKPKRITRAERKRATEFRSRVMGGCRHEPRCPSVDACLETIVLGFREAAHAPPSTDDEVTEADLEMASAGGRGG